MEDETELRETSTEDEEYEVQLHKLLADWGLLYRDKNSPGILRATKDPTAGIVVGMRAPLIAEIINRALAAKDAAITAGARRAKSRRL